VFFRYNHPMTPKQATACLSLLALIIVLGGAGASAVAAPLLQLTPFPHLLRSRRAHHLYRPGWRYAAAHLTHLRVTVDELRGLNNLVGDISSSGKRYCWAWRAIRGHSDPGPSPTPHPCCPPLPQAGLGNLCIIYTTISTGFDPPGRGAVHPGGAISVNNRSGSIAQTVDTLT